jgi:FkbM family methyltransferase
MHFSLVMVGAHDGSRTENFIRGQAALGAVLLIEPVPFLFNRLSSRYAALPNVRLRNFAISTDDGEIEFTAPRESANSVCSYGDQLGSLLPDHAAGNHPGMSQHVERIRTRAFRFETLIDTENISSIDILFTDTEGMDAELLPTFPFSRVMPSRLFFEFKHSDGCGRVGRKLARLLNILDDHGYLISVADNENMFAKHRSFKG